MKIIGKDADIIWEWRDRPISEPPPWPSAPKSGTYIAKLSKDGRVIDSKVIYSLYAEGKEVEFFAEWLKMNQRGPESSTNYQHFDFTEPDLGLRREIINSEDVRLTFIFDWREDKPDTFSIVTPESELIRAAEDYLEENKF